MAEPRYYRNRRGEIVHRADCPRLGSTATPWPYAQFMAADRIREVIEMYPWLRGCGICHPEVARTDDQFDDGL